MQIVHGTLDDGVLIFPDRAVQVHVQSERVRAGDDRLAQLPPSERAGQGDILPSCRQVVAARGAELGDEAFREPAHGETMHATTTARNGARLRGGL